MKRCFIVLIMILCLSLTGFGQKRIANIPDIPGFITLKCDFHMHTVFSDGNVWPVYRIDEAVRDGLDAIAITDHLEYLPKKDYVPVDHNAAWKICETYARERNIILVHGTEITRSMPPGHVNAIFIKDAALIAVDSVWDAYEAAVKQGAFLFWNHPGWKSQQPDGVPRMYDIHHRLLKNGWLKGVEFYNDSEHYPKVMTFAKEYGLTLFANSDVHGIISERYSDPALFHRPMTLVFAKTRTHDDLKEALFAGRTLAYFRNTIAGKEEYARPFFDNCITVGKPFFQNDKSIFLEVTNKSDIPFYLINGVANAPAAITLAANSVTRIIISNKLASPLTYDVKNILTGENETLRVELKY